MRGRVDEDFTHSYLYMIEALALFTFCDVTMCRYLPWQRSKFCEVSEGYPTLTLMNICLAVKFTESTISVVCDIIYLLYFVDTIDGTPEQQMQTTALFVLNIIFGIVVVLAAVLVMCIRGGVLSKLSKEELQKEREGTSGLSSAVKDGDGGQEERQTPKRVSNMEVVDIYNPMGALENGRPSSMVNPSHISVTQKQVFNLQEELRAKDEALRAKDEELREVRESSAYLRERQLSSVEII